jgi:hypothetical protein
MRFFTPEWHRGELSDAESDAVIASYGAHVHAFARSASEQASKLANGPSLHDALVESAQLDFRRRRLHLHLVAGDRQRGYFLRKIVYDGVRTDLLTSSPLAVVANDPRSELLYDELDIASENSYSHRYLFWPEYREVEVVFEQVRISDEAREDRSVHAMTSRYSEFGAPAA